MKTAIIGLGSIGSRVAANLAAGNQNIIISQRDLAKAAECARKLDSNAEVMPIDEAVKAADIIILAVWFDAIKDFIGTHRKDLASKIIVDPSNPIAPDGKGGFKKTIAADQSTGAIIADLLPSEVRLVKAFGTLSAESLGKNANRTPERAVLFYATDDPKAGQAVAKLIETSGFSPVSIGGIDQSIRIEVGGHLHEFGKLGRLVTASEAEALL